MASIQIGKVEELKSKKRDLSIQFNFPAQMGNRTAIRVTARINKPKHLLKISVILGLLDSLLKLLRCN